MQHFMHISNRGNLKVKVKRESLKMVPVEHVEYLVYTIAPDNF